jgi:hypothetical protein
MSRPEFVQGFGTEAACAEAARCSRWPGGFVCPRCNAGAYCVVVSGSGWLYQCHACHRQTSLTAVSLFGNTKLPMTRWFLVIYSSAKPSQAKPSQAKPSQAKPSQAKPSQAKTGLSALELKRHVGVSYPTAWLMHHKIMTAMATREAQFRLSGTVQVDDAHLGGERAGGKPGRGSENKVPFIVAFSLNDTGNPLYAKVTPVPGFTSDASPTDSTGASTSPSGSCGSLWASLGARPHRNASFGMLSFFTNQVR